MKQEQLTKSLQNKVDDLTLDILYISEDIKSFAQEIKTRREWYSQEAKDLDRENSALKRSLKSTENKIKELWKTAKKRAKKKKQTKS